MWWFQHSVRFGYIYTNVQEIQIFAYYIKVSKDMHLF